MTVVRDVSGNPLLIVENDDTIEVFFYGDKKIARLELKKHVPESVKILKEKIEEGKITAEDLLKFVD